MNKTDLLTEPEDSEYLNAFCYLYRSIGYKVLEISAKTGEGLEKLRKCLQGKTTLLSGNSGVGKSTLVNDLIPGLELRTPACTPPHSPNCFTCPEAAR